MVGQEIAVDVGAEWVIVEERSRRGRVWRAASQARRRFDSMEDQLEYEISGIVRRDFFGSAIEFEVASESIRESRAHVRRRRVTRIAFDACELQTLALVNVTTETF